MSGSSSLRPYHAVVLATILVSGRAQVAAHQVDGKLEISITEWNVPAANTMPRDMFVSKRNGFAWYSGELANVLGSFDPKTQKFEQYHLRPGSNPYCVVEHSGSGVQSTIYFTSHTGGFIGEFDPNRRDVREFRIPGSKLALRDITFDRNGVVWFTVTNPSKIGSLNLFSSEVKLAETPTPSASPYSVAVNSKGTPFFTELNKAQLGSIDPVAMKITEYTFPNTATRGKSLVITPDDAVWYTDSSRGFLGRFDPQSGSFSEWASPGGSGSPPDAITRVGKIIWYTEAGPNPRVVRFDPETQQFQSWPLKAGAAIERIYAHSDGSLWFTRPSGNSIVRVAIKDMQKQSSNEEGIR